MNAGSLGTYWPVGGSATARHEVEEEERVGRETEADLPRAARLGAAAAARAAAMGAASAIMQADIVFSRMGIKRTLLTTRATIQIAAREYRRGRSAIKHDFVERSLGSHSGGGGEVQRRPGTVFAFLFRDANGYYSWALTRTCFGGRNLQGAGDNPPNVPPALRSRRSP